MKTRQRGLWMGLVCVGASCVLGSQLSLVTPTTDLSGGYAVVISEATYADPAWKPVAEALLRKYPDAKLHTYKKDLSEVKAVLALTLPRFTCVVSKPEDTGHEMILTLSRMMRHLDDDPYVDSFWSVLTGYEAADALRIANRSEPLKIERALDCLGFDLTVFKQAVSYREVHRGVVKTWKMGDADVISMPCDTDNTQGVIKALCEDKAQLMATSAHATQRGWYMGYCGPNLVMHHKDGQLYAHDTKKNVIPVTCPEPKIYMGTGNCLIGDIDQRDCMATSWMHTGGAYQFLGYTVTTWFGTMGWGTMGSFVDKAGLYTLPEAFHFNNTRMIDWLIERSPEYATWNMPTFDYKRLTSPADLKDVAQRTKTKPSDIVGYIHDRDVVALYGDPAWDARIHARFERITKVDTLDEATGTQRITLTVIAMKDIDFPDEGIYLALPGSFTYELKDVQVEGLTDPTLQCVDNFICVRMKDTQLKRDDVFTLRMKAKRKMAESITPHRL